MAVADPTSLEERTAESEMIFGLNSFRELCCINLGGGTLANSRLLIQCAEKAANHAKAVVEFIKQALEEDDNLRKSGKNVGFHECLRLNTFSGLAESKLALRLRYFNFDNIEKSSLKSNVKDEEDEQEKPLQENCMFLLLLLLLLYIYN